MPKPCTLRGLPTNQQTAGLWLGGHPNRDSPKQGDWAFCDPPKQLALPADKEENKKKYGVIKEYNQER